MVIVRALTGAENCLEGLTFVITGVLESLERDDAADAIKKYGGKVTTSISGRTSYVVVGEEAGESKMAKVGDVVGEDSLICVFVVGSSTTYNLVLRV